jgi:ribosomal protein S18 acetylase RimI-like enzyme
MRSELIGRGYTVAECTRAMGMRLDAAGAPPEVELGPSRWADHLRYLQDVGAPDGLLDGTAPRAFHVLTATLDGENVATAIAFDHDGDCGVFNVGTLEAARHRGLASALTAHLVHDAAERGCSTASLQSTLMAERVYATLGFRDLGRILEYVPQVLDSGSRNHPRDYSPTRSTNGATHDESANPHPRPLRDAPDRR